ncbi:hypothetical protein KKI24_14300 [bacterium]|nr:hypothetical protein [bacterium]
MSAALEALFGDFDFTGDSDRGAGLLPEFLKNSENAIALINAILEEVQELHEAQKDVFSTINIYDAVGDQLDDIFGEILDLERKIGQTDSEYRADLLSRTAEIARSGEILTMKNAFRAIMQASSVRLFEYQPATFKLEATVSSIPTAAELAKIRQSMAKIKQGGNTMLLSCNDTTAFTLVSENPQLNSPSGLTDGTFTGGTLSTGF